MRTLELKSIKEIKEVLQLGVKKVAPLWSLENFVAVNPYLGITDKKFEEAIAFLKNTADVNGTLPVSFYRDQLEAGEITKEDIEKALKTMSSTHPSTKNAEQFIQSLYATEDTTFVGNSVCTFLCFIEKITGKDWNRFRTDRVSFWASSYFDADQTIWKTAFLESSLYKAWKKEASIDRTTEIMGLKGFRKELNNFSEDYLEAAQQALSILNVPTNQLEAYLTALIFKLNGWAGVTARLDWEANLKDETSSATAEFLTILLVWEAVIFELFKSQEITYKWNEIWNERINYQESDNELSQLLVLQKSLDCANQRQLIQVINSQSPIVKEHKQADVQAIFCIDVRSEVYRRNLEAIDNNIETLGFAGFFAFPVKYVALAHEHGKDQCPVLLNTSHTVNEVLVDQKSTQKAIEQRYESHFVSRAWKSFKLGAISCFSFVGPVGLSFLPKLFTDSFGLTRPVSDPSKSGISNQLHDAKTIELTPKNKALIQGIPMEDRVNMAMGALKAMSLTDNFAKIVLIVGHGSTSVNNPHATGLDCGACGGNTGEANAKVAAAVLNDEEVRKALLEKDIAIPQTTLFVAALHDTTTDEVRLYQPAKGWPNSHQSDFQKLSENLSTASAASRIERAKRLGISEGNLNKQVLKRSKDWSQVRPEWGLAGCSSFIVAPRERTQRLDFNGKAFMHSYLWEKDEDFSVLELIMTAPMVVTSWINLQYYASTVDNVKFGAGNKTLHNVVGGVGVLEGFGGDLRTGLPWQSIHDGKNFQHEPKRLNVFIEAPADAMSLILEKHQDVRNLCDNEWIYLFAMKEGRVAYKYIGDLQWEKVID